MDALIETFHLDAKLIIAQLVNFVIVLGVLWWFALKPLIKIMQERSDTIAKSLAQAKAIEEKMAAADSERAAVLTKAKQDALAVLALAKQDAAAVQQEALQKTKGEVEKIVAKGKAQLMIEKDKMSEELKGAMAGLVVAATKKVLGSALTKEVDKKVAEEAIKEIQK